MHIKEDMSIPIELLKYANEINYLANKLNNCNNKIVIYGFNEVGFFLYKIFKSRVADIIDIAKKGEIVDDISIKAIEDYEYNSNNIFIITIVSNSTNKIVANTIVSKFNKPTIYSINDYYFDEKWQKSKYCPICETHSNHFRPFGLKLRYDAQCPNCDALERDRFNWLFIKQRGLLSDTSIKMLHIAPEKELGAKFKSILTQNYLSADLANKAMVQMDVTNINFTDDSFDCIYCSHVLEHIIDDKKAMCELFRVLKTGGWAILNVPIFASGATEEDFSVTDPRERERLYGQYDHVRNYGYDYVDRLRACGFNVEVVKPKDCFDDELIEKTAITSFGYDEIFFCRK